MKSLHQAYLDVSIGLPIEDSSVSARLERAFDILRVCTITLQQCGVVAVSKEYNIGENKQKGLYGFLKIGSNVPYMVTSKTCTCPDYYERARAGLCKHRLAVLILEEMLHG